MTAKIFKDGDMKSVYYKRLMADRMDLSAGERIVYSNLLYDAICNWEDAWDKEYGSFETINLDDEETIPLGFSISCNKVCERLPISRSNAGYIINNLLKNGFIDDDKERIRHNRMYEEGYFTLKTESGLKGELLIFYSWLCNISKNRKLIYCSRNKLSEMYNTSVNVVMKFLKQLKKVGLVERDENNNLIINY